MHFLNGHFILKVNMHGHTLCEWCSSSAPWELVRLFYHLLQTTLIEST